jgi:hypothetical protein
MKLLLKHLFWKNVQSMLKLGRAQGVAMAAGSRDIPITEYEPKNKWQLPETEMPVRSKLPKCYNNFGTERIT